MMTQLDQKSEEVEASEERRSDLSFFVSILLSEELFGWWLVRGTFCDVLSSSV